MANERGRRGRPLAPPRRFLLIAVALSVMVHLAAALLIVTLPRVLPREPPPVEQGTVELLMVEQKGAQPGDANHPPQDQPVQSQPQPPAEPAPQRAQTQPPPPEPTLQPAQSQPKPPDPQPDKPQQAAQPTQNQPPPAQQAQKQPPPAQQAQNQPPAPQPAEPAAATKSEPDKAAAEAKTETAASVQAAPPPQAGDEPLPPPAAPPAPDATAAQPPPTEPAQPPAAEATPTQPPPPTDAKPEPKPTREAAATDHPPDASARNENPPPPARPEDKTVPTAKPEQQADAQPQPSPPKPQEAPVFDLAGTESESNAIALGRQIVPASPDNRFRNRPPIYPQEAANRGEHGTVVVLIHVSEGGVATGVDVVQSSGIDSLDRAAVTAVRKWRFRPALQEGRAVPFDMPFRFVFEAY